MCRDGHLGERPQSELKLLAVTVHDEPEIQHSNRAASDSLAGAIHIELPGRALVGVEGSMDPALVRAVLESLRS